MNVLFFDQRFSNKLFILV